MRNSQFDYMRVAHRFEGGNPNFLGVRVLRRGAEFLQSIGLPVMRPSARAYVDVHACAREQRAQDDDPAENWDEDSHIVNVLVPDADALMTTLREKHRGDCYVRTVRCVCPCRSSITSRTSSARWMRSSPSRVASPRLRFADSGSERRKHEQQRHSRDNQTDGGRTSGDGLYIHRRTTLAPRRVSSTISWTCA